MNINKICMVLIVLFVSIGVSYGAEAWITENPNATSVRMSELTATIHIHIKNNNNQVQYFKISQEYFKTTPAMEWQIVWTSPAAVKMVKSSYPELGGDYGWKLKPGETKTICFKLKNTGPTPPLPEWYIIRNNSQENQYWPLVPEPGITATWFFPNELEMLNPQLDLQLWQGTFNFKLRNVDSKTVSGIVRAPIVPMNSKLTYSKPKAFIDDDSMVNAQTAAWDVTMAAGAQRYFTYQYIWPSSSSHDTGYGKYSSSLPTTSAASTTSSVPTKATGVPYALFVIAAIVTGAGVVYAKFVR